MATALATACGPMGAGPTARETRPVTLTYMANLPATHPEGKAFLDLLEEYNRTNTEKATVKLDEGQATTTEEKMLTLATAGTPPDLARIAWFKGPMLYVAGATADLEELLKKERAWGKQKTEMLAGTVDDSKWGGKLVSMPGTRGLTVMIYSPALLARAGVPAPKFGWTWSDFREAALKAGRPPDTWGLSFKWINAHWLPWVGSLGASVISPDRRKMLINSPEVLEATEFIVSLFRSNLTNPEGKTELFQQGTNATVFEQQGNFRLPTFRQKGITDVAVTHHPGHPVKKVPTGNVDGHDLAVFKGVPPERQDAAARVVMWMNGPYAQPRIAMKANVMPVHKPAYESKELQDYLKTEPLVKAFMDLMPAIRPGRFAPLPSYDKMVGEMINPALKQLYEQKVSVRNGLADLQRLAQQLLDEDLKTLR
jgi:ABC-type glycerol-3-phosphate transport system substrate-binding protein